MSDTKVQSTRESAREARALARAFRELDRLNSFSPSEKAREIVKAREKENARESLKAAARDMGISAAELASDIIAERTFAENAPVNAQPKEWEAGITIVESKERRSFIKGIILAEKATRPDYRIARELLNTIGRDSGVVVSSLPTGEIAVNGVYRSVDPEYARGMQFRALANAQKVMARIESAEKAIENAPLKKATPAMKKELADANKAMVIARGRLARADKRVIESQQKSANGFRMEEKARFSWEALRDAIALDRLAPAIECWELPAQIERRPFRESIRPRIRRNPISPVECEVLRNEYIRESAIARELVKAETEKILAEKAESERIEKENARSAQIANRRMADTMRKRNARAAKKNAR